MSTGIKPRYIVTRIDKGLFFLFKIEAERLYHYIRESQEWRPLSDSWWVIRRGACYESSCFNEAVERVIEMTTEDGSHDRAQSWLEVL